MCSLSLKLPHQNPVCTFLSRVRATYPTRLIPLNWITRIIVGIYNVREGFMFSKTLKFSVLLSADLGWDARACCLMALTVANITLRQGHIPAKDWVWNMGFEIVTAEDISTRRKSVRTDLKHLSSNHASHGIAGCDVD